MEYNNLTIFKDITNYNEVVKSFKLIHYKQGEIIFNEKEDNNNFYYLISGKVTLYSYTSNGKKRIYLTISDDTIINNYDETFNNTPYSAQVFEKATVLKIDQVILFNLLSNNVTLLKNFLFLQSHRNRRLYRQLKNSNSINLEKKIAAKLWKYAKDYGIVCDGKVCINFKINNTYLADNIGCSRESVSRTIKKLNDKGLVWIVKNKYYVLIDELLIFYRQDD